MVYRYDEDAEQSQSYFGRWFDNGYFVAGPSTEFYGQTQRPFNAVIDLTTATVMDEGYLHAGDLLDLVAEANQ